MKNIFFTLLVATCLSNAAWADEGRWHQPRFEHGRPEFQHDHHEWHGGYGHRGWGWTPWFSAAAIGTTIYLANQYIPPPATVYITPPVVNDPTRVAYFCQPFQQYYPNTPTCPVPWQVVPF